MTAGLVGGILVWTVYYGDSQSVGEGMIHHIGERW
jgi:hypothetical protein